ncbi:MAG: hypothetical protein V3T83_21695 [Acidobacteriota bacterium]
MTLQERLDRTKKSFASKASPEIVAAFKRATQELIDSGKAGKALGEGDRAPHFRLTNTRGEMVDSQHLLAQGPLMVTFYRGEW